MRRFNQIIWLFASATSAALAGAQIELRPNPPQPPGGYSPCSVIRIEVILVDTGNSQDDIRFRYLTLDFDDTSSQLTFPGYDGITGNSDDDQFEWICPFGVCGRSPVLPRPWWVYTSIVPTFQLTLPNEGEVIIGEFAVNVGIAGGTIDVLNADEPNFDFGARADFGLGTPEDPLTTWRAFTGELTGGLWALEVAVPGVGDFDDDSDVDLVDFHLLHENFCNWTCQFEICFCDPPAEPDEVADLNQDGEVDLEDAGFFQNVFTASCE